MTRFVRVTDAANNKIFYINVDHVRSVTEIPRGSQISFADGGATLAVSKGLEAVMKVIDPGNSAGYLYLPEYSMRVGLTRTAAAVAASARASRAAKE